MMRTPVQNGSSRDASDEAAFLAYLRATGLLRRAMEPYFARHGISGAQWGVLKALYKSKADGHEGVRLSELGDKLLIRPPSVTGVVDRLERHGLVARKSDGLDLRAKRVHLTNEGDALVTRIKAGHSQQIRLCMGGLNDRQQTQFQSLLDRMADHLEQVVDPCSPKEIHLDRQPVH